MNILSLAGLSTSTIVVCLIIGLVAKKLLKAMLTIIILVCIVAGYFLIKNWDNPDWQPVKKIVQNTYK